ncbi:PHA/PHB synthase family protein [Salinisphaera japonica]|uniref:Poly(R)-hydroxyalkanoic acid synthase n=1 Tax=Salinisphaera japonica YTM-1 TaxID=1209778 RepID=A0A423Q1F7_9GAMM|nr:alpha/beta fold hydrolase [Salinisphaera japonica]ROO32304.1 poly(R)-hydroxyalkanoic acid synthase [Salinisphaera japonica YTM-1]
MDPSRRAEWPSLSRSMSELVAASARQPLTVARIELALIARLALISVGRAPLAPRAGDRRFTDTSWQAHPVFRRSLQTYLAWSQALTDLVEALTVDDTTRDRLRFVVRHAVAAGAPSNLFFLHPGFYARVRASKGASMLTGLVQFIDDMASHQGLPRQVDTSAFTIGKNIAATPGAVIYRDALVELIQYAPATPQQDGAPILIVPPQINKFYVFDLSPDNSFVRHALAAGQAVFMLSWRNPTAAQKHWGLADYVKAVDQAIEHVAALNDGAAVKLVGACAGGLTAAVALAYRRARGPVGDTEAVSAPADVACLSLFVTLLGKSVATDDAGRAHDERVVRHALARSSTTGVLDGADMARAFAWLRPEDCVWRFVTNNYVLGQRPPASDILYWNADTTRLPARLHADLLRIYGDDALARPGGIMIDGIAIDLAAVDCDVFVMAGEKDHITPWRACHDSAARLSAPCRFVLVGAGHVQSLVCPPGEDTVYASDVCGQGETADDWQAGAPVYHESWWHEWLAWCQAHGAAPRTAPDHYGDTALGCAPLDTAPGRYVRQR